MNRLAFSFALILSVLTAPARAVSEADLLPVDQAYPLSIEAVSGDSVRIRWGIAEGYYLYKHRTAIESDNPEVTLEPLQLPAGKPYRDEFFGDVETYRKALVTTVRFDAPDGTGHVLLRLQYQGCADIGICYPPQNKRLRIPLNTAAAADGKALLGLNGASTDAALPEDQAFQIEAIVGDAGALLLKLTPAEGYYLYRDKIAFTASQDAIAAPGKAKLPEAVWYPDPEFGTVPVYFEPAEITLPLQRRTTQAGPCN